MIEELSNPDIRVYLQIVHTKSTKDKKLVQALKAELEQRYGNQVHILYPASFAACELLHHTHSSLKLATTGQVDGDFTDAIKQRIFNAIEDELTPESERTYGPF
eukprot:7675-Heterococcus_DN1.PRE.1